MYEVQQLISGRWGTGSGSREMTVVSPFDGTAVTRVPIASQADVAVAVTAARDAAPAWRRTAAGRRGAALHAAAAGRSIAAACARTGAKALLENGGSDPLIVDADVDPVWAAGQAALGAFANSGQICVAVERIYAHREVAEAFLDALVAEADKWAADIGPLVDRRLRDAVHAQVTAAVEAGRPAAARRRGAGRAGRVLPAGRARRLHRRDGGAARGDVRPGRAGGRRGLVRDRAGARGGLAVRAGRDGADRLDEPRPAGLAGAPGGHVEAPHGGW